MRWIECIPNVSEGQRPDVVAACAEAIASGGALVLDVTADPAHHRSVYTFAGSAAQLRRSVAALFAYALSTVDLRRHLGEHPRIGAVDVVPFVPLGDTTMDEAIDLARTVAADVAARHDLPVFLYEQAARDPNRQRLEVIRRGGFEGLADRMHDPAWRPDFGPAAPHPSAGAAVIGARWPLIAFNVNLATDRADVARAIARRIRESSGGLPAVKALGLVLADRGLVQVSMNLTDYRRTSIVQAYDAIDAAAAELGVAIVESELVGLAPAAALSPAIASHVKLTAFRDDLVLEHRLATLAAR